MPNTIPVAVITNADGTHLDQWLPSLAEIAEAETVAYVDPSGDTVALARKALGNKLREDAIPLNDFLAAIFVSETATVFSAPEASTRPSRAACDSKGSAGALIASPVSSSVSRRAACSRSSPASGSPFGMLHGARRL